ncbi:MAG: TfoX/Sxy family protein [Gallionella sp.]|nr:TfoX/Sxy family protein [Gallionella sp.]
MTSPQNEFVEYVREVMSHWASVSSRKIFGGYGLYRDGLMFALIAHETLYFKVDARNVAQFERAGCIPFTYQNATRTVQLSYWSAPAECLESPADMGEWSQCAYAAALRSRTDPLASRTRKAK